MGEGGGVVIGRRRVRPAVAALASLVVAACVPVVVSAQDPVPVPVPRPDTVRVPVPVPDSVRAPVPRDTVGDVPATVPTTPAVVSPPPAPSTTPWKWERSLEVAGNYLYGNNEQALFSTRTSVARSNDRWETRFDGRFLVGASNRAGDRVMDRRSWLVGVNVDRRPDDVWSQFFLASAERSFELRVDKRVTAGAGVKYVIDCDTVYRLDLSVAVLGEANALPQPVAGQPGPAPIVRSELARLSGRLRYRNQFTDRLNFDMVTWYRPELAALDRFLASGTVGVQYQVNRIAGLRFSVQHDYDSLARSRGARSNQNGQVLVGVNTRF